MVTNPSWATRSSPQNPGTMSPCPYFQVALRTESSSVEGSHASSCVAWGYLKGCCGHSAGAETEDKGTGRWRLQPWLVTPVSQPHPALPATRARESVRAQFSQSTPNWVLLLATPRPLTHTWKELLFGISLTPWGASRTSRKHEIMLRLPHVDSWSPCQSRKHIRLRTEGAGRAAACSAEAPASGDVMSAHTNRKQHEESGR